MKGNRLELAGPELKVGAKAPDAELAKSLVETTKLSTLGGSVRILSVVPSLDTGVCAEQTRRFHKQAAEMPNVRFVTISCDLPPAQARFCGAEAIDGKKMLVLSDHRTAAFGQAYGTLIPSLRIESRAVFVVDKSDTIRYAEYVPEVGEHPKYDAVIAAAKSLG